MQETRLKKELAAGKVAIGTFLGMVNPTMVEILGYAGLSFVIVDGEHGPGSLESMQNMVRAAEVVGITPLLRVSQNSGPEITRSLDAGFQGVQVPHIVTQEDARRAVDAAKYAPMGSRGVSLSSRVAHFGGVPREVHLESCNRESIVVLQIEDAEGVENLPSILEVPGIDIIFIGQNDLSGSLGFPGDTNQPVVQKAVQRCIDLCQERGIPTGTSTRTPDAVKKWADRGLRYMCGNADVMMRAAFAQFVQDCQKALG